RRAAGRPTAADGTGGAGTGGRLVRPLAGGRHARTFGLGAVRAGRWRADRQPRAGRQQRHSGRPAMKRLAKVLAGAGLALALVGAAHARQDDIDINRLRGSLDQLANDPGLGHYALSEQARAREAIRTLEEAGRGDRPHALYLAERRVDLAKSAAQLQDAQVKLNQLDREHDQILLANSRREAD